MSVTREAREFAAAARRHHDDAELLRTHGRLPNADYHYGFVVECVLKSLLLMYLGATMANNKPAIRKDKLGHMPGMWDRTKIEARGRSATRLASALGGTNPFRDYRVDHRYLGEPQLEEGTLAERRRAAQRILELHQWAFIAGGLR
ncbi:hypothetical protein ABZ234_25195 [Nocardiopsis sp. NPDC006198]|uniref:hypothetical protein n=1 Tax=Nocardiopsis sp. NPDC006198 TaxID=3154472 RepID=UPI0033B1608C